MTDYIELALLKDELKIPTSDTTRDISLQVNIAAASQAIENRCGRVFSRDPVATARIFNPAGRVVVERARGEFRGERLLVDDIADATAVVAGVQGVVLHELNCFAKRWPATSILRPFASWAGMRQVEITAVWGWPEVPATIQQACLLQALRLSRRPGSPEGVAGSAEWGLVRIPHLDPDVRHLVEPYRLPGIA